MTDILNSELLDTVTHAFTLTSDEQIAQLDAAAATLAEALRERPMNIPVSVLVALDPGVSSDAFALTQAEQHLRVVWKSLSSQHKLRPVGLLRYVLLQSLRHLRDTPDLSSAIHLLARDPLTWIERGSEQITLDKWLAEFSLKPISIEKDSKPPNSSAKPKKLELSKLELEKPLGSQISQALSQQTFTVSSPNYGVFTIQPDWADPAALKIATAIQGALVQLTTHLEEQLKPVLDSLIPPPVPRHAVTQQQYLTLERKTNLMYWLQAHYSSSFERRYRTLSPYAAALVMAHDLHTLDGEVPGPEVEAVLEEALFMVFREESETQKTLLEAVKAVVTTPEIGRVLSSPGEFQGRDTLLEVVSRCVYDGSTKLSSALLERHLGIPGKTLISPTAFGLWSLRVKAALAVLG